LRIRAEYIKEIATKSKQKINEPSREFVRFGHEEKGI
jgi:hypothetical protein